MGQLVMFNVIPRQPAVAAVMNRSLHCCAHTYNNDLNPQGLNSLEALAYSPNGALLAAGAGDGGVGLYDVADR